MAISKERLEELINQGVKIYDSWHGNEFCVRDIEKIEDDVITYSFLLDEYKTTLEDLHENYDDFKWYKEFSCIEWVERLKLPTWKKFDDKTFIWFLDKNQNQCCLYYRKCAKQIVINISGEVIEIGELTKENYYKACRKAKELFLNGESKNAD